MEVDAPTIINLIQKVLLCCSGNTTAKEEAAIEAACLLWDLTIDVTIVEFLHNHSMLLVLEELLSQAHSPRLIEV